MNLPNLSQQILNEMFEDGTVQKTFRARLENTVTEMAKELLSSYSEFGKQIKSAIQQQMNLNLSKLNLQDWNATIASVVGEALNKYAYGAAAEQINTAVALYIGIIDKKAWKLSELMEEFKKTRDRLNDECHEMYLDVEDSTVSNSSLVWVRFSETKRRYASSRDLTPYDAEYKMLVDSKHGCLCSFWIEGKLKSAGAADPNADSFNKLLYRLWANGATIELDSDDVDLYYEGYSD